MICAPVSARISIGQTVSDAVPEAAPPLPRAANQARAGWTPDIRSSPPDPSRQSDGGTATGEWRRGRGRRAGTGGGTGTRDGAGGRAPDAGAQVGGGTWACVA